MLSDEVPSGAGILASPAAEPLAVGLVGKAHTQLRPSGKADFGGQLVDVVTRGDLIEPGSAVRILAVEGARVVVAAG